MNPISATEPQRLYWYIRDGADNRTAVIGGPKEAPDVIPCPTLVVPELGICHVAYQLDEIEVASLAQGHTLWLTTWGGLPIHDLEVINPYTVIGGVGVKDEV